MQLVVASSDTELKTYDIRQLLDVYKRQGLDTVVLKGAPFTSHISVGDQVKKGDLLMEADLEQIKAADLNVITCLLYTSCPDAKRIIHSLCFFI